MKKNIDALYWLYETEIDTYTKVATILIQKDKYLRPEAYKTKIFETLYNPHNIGKYKDGTTKNLYSP